MLDLTGDRPGTAPHFRFSGSGGVFDVQSYKPCIAYGLIGDMGRCRCVAYSVRQLEAQADGSVEEQVIDENMTFAEAKALAERLSASVPLPAAEADTIVLETITVAATNAL